MPVDRTTGADTGMLLEFDLGGQLLELYLDLERKLAADIARLLAAGMQSPAWAQQKLAAVRELRQAAEMLLQQAARDTDGLVAQALVLAYMRGGEAANRELAKMGTPLTVAFAAERLQQQPGMALSAIVNANRVEAAAKLARATAAFPGLGALQRMVWSLAARIRSTYLPILRWAEDVYREVIAKTALPGVLMGVLTRRRAAQVAWERLLSDGVKGFTDKSGRRWDLASYVEMAVRSGVAQAAVEGHLDRLADAKIDYVIVSDAPQECVKCRPWEGKILARTGPPGPRTIMLPSALTGQLVEVHIAGTVAEAILAGLMHPNCRHSLSAYLVGATRIPRHTADPDGDEARQQLRYMERQVRKAKLKAQAAIDPAAVKRHASGARQWQAKIREHVTATEHLGIKRQPGRELIGTAR